MTDGLYQVTTPYLCAGFEVRGGRVTICAPILRTKLAYWKTKAVLVAGLAEGDAMNNKLPNGGRT